MGKVKKVVRKKVKPDPTRASIHAILNEQGISDEEALKRIRAVMYGDSK